MTGKNTLYFRQLLAGRDYARAHPIAPQLVNFAYLVGDREAGQCLVVDPSWDPRGLLAAAAEDGMEVTGILATHDHPDHVGGDLFGHAVAGVAELVEEMGHKVHCHPEDAADLQQVTGISEASLSLTEGGDVIEVGSVHIDTVHTPGHTPGSLCYLVRGHLVAGDTLFVQGCGRVDLPGGDAAELHRSLHQRLAHLPDETVLYPGHHYGPRPTSTLGEERRDNYALKMKDLDEWLRLMGS